MGIDNIIRGPILLSLVKSASSISQMHTKKILLCFKLKKGSGSKNIQLIDKNVLLSGVVGRALIMANQISYSTF